MKCISPRLQVRTSKGGVRFWVCIHVWIDTCGGVRLCGGTCQYMPSYGGITRVGVANAEQHDNAVIYIRNCACTRNRRPNITMCLFVLGCQFWGACTRQHIPCEVLHPRIRL